MTTLAHSTRTVPHHDEDVIRLHQDRPVLDSIKGRRRLPEDYFFNPQDPTRRYRWSLSEISVGDRVTVPGRAGVATITNKPWIDNQAYGKIQIRFDNSDVEEWVEREEITTNAEHCLGIETVPSEKSIFERRRLPSSDSSKFNQKAPRSHRLHPQDSPLPENQRWLKIRDNGVDTGEWEKVEILGKGKFPTCGEDGTGNGYYQPGFYQHGFYPPAAKTAQEAVSKKKSPYCPACKIYGNRWAKAVFRGEVLSELSSHLWCSEGDRLVRYVPVVDLMDSNCQPSGIKVGLACNACGTRKSPESEKCTKCKEFKHWVVPDSRRRLTSRILCALLKEIEASA